MTPTEIVLSSKSENNLNIVLQTTCYFVWFHVLMIILMTNALFWFDTMYSWSNLPNFSKEHAATKFSVQDTDIYLCYREI